MAKFLKFNPGPFQAPMPPEDKPEGQMLRYLQGKYKDQPVDQFELMLELNTHQKDGVVVKQPTVRPLSQLFGFKVSEWVKAGFAERVTAKATTVAAPGKMARMEAHIKALEAALAAANLPYTPFVWEAPKAPETPAEGTPTNEVQPAAGEAQPAAA